MPKEAGSLGGDFPICLTLLRACPARSPARPASPWPAPSTWSLPARPRSSAGLVSDRGNAAGVTVCPRPSRIRREIGVWFGGQSRPWTPRAIGPRRRRMRPTGSLRKRPSWSLVIVIVRARTEVPLFFKVSLTLDLQITIAGKLS